MNSQSDMLSTANYDKTLKKQSTLQTKKIFMSKYQLRGLFDK